MKAAEFQPARDLYKDFQQSEYYDENLPYLDLLRNLGEFVKSRNLNPVASKQLFRRMANYLRPLAEQHYKRR